MAVEGPTRPNQGVGEPILLVPAIQLLGLGLEPARAGKIAIRARAMREAQIAWADEEARKRVDWIRGEAGRRMLCEEEVERAGRLIDAGEHDLAISVAETVLDMAAQADDRGVWPGLRRRARQLQAVAHAEAGRKGKACELLEQMAACRPWDRELYLELALMLADDRQPAAAAEVLAQAIEADESLRPYLIRLGMMEARVMQYEKSALHFKQHLAARPWDYGAWTLRGGVLNAMGRTDEAREHYRQALEIRPGSVPRSGPWQTCLGWSWRPGSHPLEMSMKPKLALIFIIVTVAVLLAGCKQISGRAENGRARWCKLWTWGPGGVTAVCIDGYQYLTYMNDGIVQSMDASGSYGGSSPIKCSCGQAN